MSRFFKGIEGFFYHARERYEMLLKKRKGINICTEDEAMKNTRLCNVFREDDKTTVWFRENIRERKRNNLDVLFQTVAFRWFNKIEIGQLLSQNQITGFRRGYWDRVAVERYIRKIYPKGPWVTGAFIVYTPPGKDKLTGVLDYIDDFHEKITYYKAALYSCQTLEDARNILVRAPGLGNFMAYQIVCDLRYTLYLDEALDIDDWAQLGPGSARGLGWIFHNDPNKYNYTSKKDCKAVLPLMSQLLALSRKQGLWSSKWGRWELSTVQHWLCEHDKICRVRESPDARMKRKYV